MDSRAEQGARRRRYFMDDKLLLRRECRQCRTRMTTWERMIGVLYCSISMRRREMDASPIPASEPLRLLTACV
jgi:hypothetical protein